MSKATIRNIILAIILLVGTALVLWFVLSKVIKEGDNLAIQIDTLAEQSAQEDSFYKLRRISEDTKFDRTELTSHFLVRESDSIDFLNKVESIALSVGVVLDTTSLDTVTDKDSGSKWIEVGYVIKGSRERVQTFIKILEQLPYVSRLMSINMKSLSNTEWMASVKMKVMVLSYDE